MKSLTLIKALTLLSFITLIALFLFYKTGRFDTYLAENTSSFNERIDIDTVKGTQKDTSKALPRTSSSPAPERVFTDTLPAKLKKAEAREVYMMSGSKSARAFTTPLVQLNIDSVIKLSVDSMFKRSGKKLKKKIQQ